MVSRIICFKKQPSGVELADSVTPYFESKNQQCNILVFQLLLTIYPMFINDALASE